MDEVQTIIQESKIFYDKFGECWVSFHVPKEVDVGDMGMNLWLEYVSYLNLLDTKPDAVQEALCPA